MLGKHVQCTVSEDTQGTVQWVPELAELLRNTFSIWSQQHAYICDRVFCTISIDKPKTQDFLLIIDQSVNNITVHSCQVIWPVQSTSENLLISAAQLLYYSQNKSAASSAQITTPLTKGHKQCCSQDSDNQDEDSRLQDPDWNLRPRH